MGSICSLDGDFSAQGERSRQVTWHLLNGRNLTDFPTMPSSSQGRIFQKPTSYIARAIFDAYVQTGKPEIERTIQGLIEGMSSSM
jgi:hypothetical protein